MKNYEVVLTDKKTGKEIARMKSSISTKIESSDITDDTKWIPITIEALVSPNELKRIKGADVE
jgi:predicted secreted protein